MQGNSRRESRPELALRRTLHALGFRYRKNQRFEAAGRWVRPDIVFGAARVAVFVDGCHWHRCPDHSRQPKANAEYWNAKFARNVARDRADDTALASAGWTVVRIWEHEDVEAAARHIAMWVEAGRQHR
jgi:DNA mismatch endonuclease, patch repair protein